MANEFGVTFAPTEDQAELARRRGQQGAVPEAIKVLSLHMPKFLGARAPTQLQSGSSGTDPYLSAVMQSLVKTLAPAPLPGGTAGYAPLPYQAPPLFPSEGQDPGPGAPPPAPKNPRVNWQDLPDAGGGTGTPGLPTFDEKRRSKDPYGDGWSRNTI